jgi:hypothetical protein
MRSRISLSILGRPPRWRDFLRQQARKPRRCHWITVSGLTTVLASRIEGNSRYSQTKIGRSMFLSHTRDPDLRLSTITADARQCFRPRVSPVTSAEIVRRAGAWTETRPSGVRLSQSDRPVTLDQVFGTDTYRAVSVSGSSRRAPCNRRGASFLIRSPPRGNVPRRAWNHGLFRRFHVTAGHRDLLKLTERANMRPEFPLRISVQMEFLVVTTGY